MRTNFRLFVAFSLIASLAVASVSVSAHHDGSGEYHPIERDEFETVWERTDRPVLETVVARTWMWSPGAFSNLLVEDYVEGEDGEREVQYFDKSRMEMPTLGAADTEDTDSPWFITQGLLARELMTGQLQIGDDEFEDHSPSGRSAGGDPEDVTAPTYAAMGTLIEREPRAGGEVIIEYADRDGNIVEDADRFADHGVTDVDDAYDAEAIEGLDKNIASVFWDFMTSEGTVYENGNFVEDQPVVLNPFYAVGFPLTDAFWADVMVEGEVQDVLIQCFERRCLTFTPGNPDGWQVESGNIGQHYYDWRYNEIDREEPVDPVDPVEPTDFTFTVDGESAVTIDVGQQILATANVTANGEPVAGVEVEFWAEDGGGTVFELDPPFTVNTDAEGNASINVRGIGEGTLDVNANVEIAGVVQTESVSVTVGEPAVEPETHTVTMSDADFVNGDITIAVGDTVVWDNTSNVQHNVTSGDFESSGTMDPGDTHTVTFNSPGTYDYECTFHPGMTGTITVE